MEAIDDRNLERIRPLPAPREIKARLPLSPSAARTVSDARAGLRAAIHGRDARLVVIVGPCSIHDPEAALDYAERLADLARELSGELLLVMRTYFEKPRTTVGWKGLINDPHLDGSRDVVAGLEIARSLLLGINERGVPCASEVLDPFTPQFVADLLAWASIGARTSESQTHRELASTPPETRWWPPATRTAFSASTPRGDPRWSRRPGIPTGTSCCAEAAGARTTGARTSRPRWLSWPTSESRVR
jgi:3-deoxy-7-phosphoheptulonate synthase